MNKAVLIAHDEPRIARELRTKLLAQNYEVLCATNLEEALARFDLRLIDLLLLDLDVPTQDSWSALARISELTPAPRLIGLTERSDMAEMAIRARLGAVAEKPLHVRSLLRAIDEMLTQMPSRTGFHYIPRATATF